MSEHDNGIGVALRLAGYHWKRHDLFDYFYDAESRYVGYVVEDVYSPVTEVGSWLPVATLDGRLRVVASRQDKEAAMMAVEHAVAGHLGLI
jgi:hypothetical protein